MRKIMLSIATVLAMTLSGFAVAGEDGPRCFDENENKAELTMVERKDAMTGAVKKFEVASSAVNHFTSCLATVIAGAASGTVLDLCGCLDVAKELCGGTGPKDWKDSAMGLSKCTTMFRG